MAGARDGGGAGAQPLRRGVTLAEQLAASSNLRNLLKLRDDGESDGRLAAAGRRRTLLDVIRGADDDRPPTVASGRRSVRPALGGTGGTATAASTAAARGERVSLMALLERTEQQLPACAGGGQWKRVDVEEEEEAEKGGGGGVGARCCVCVARGKGAAFIPCGHTFCRACARELRAGRGRCPLCNAAIREVLNLF
ncbi:E3 ubiquitin-protein ligase ORTHRUS 1-like [Phragmites australis]|uniref:E3 ubiquitin-protein ligase ORTHRUS 1-like n=1 Tax=Phragmites australis TaxID=29695 RepID=UPI002D77CDE0|nr:E3 ubiquitin-protein ligase ORTHRUS 1-like [Phragmites australis]